MASSDPAPEAAPAAEDEVKPVSPWAEYMDLGKTVAYALLIALVLRIVLFQPYTIPSASMEPALTEGDYIIVSKYAYGWSRRSIPFAPPLFKGRIFAHQPKRGDVVVFAFPADPTKDFIKRLIALPGDTVQVKQGLVYVNGQATNETKLTPAVSDTAFEGGPMQLDRFQETVGKHRFVTYSRNRDDQVDTTGLFTVPKGCYFMMGDNRDNSLDSRYASGISECASQTPQPFQMANEPGVGFVPAEDLEGKAEIILVSWKQGSSLFKPWTWLNLNWGRLFRPIP